MKLSSNKANHNSHSKCISFIFAIIVLSYSANWLIYIGDHLGNHGHQLSTLEFSYYVVEILIYVGFVVFSFTALLATISHKRSFHGSIKLGVAALLAKLIEQSSWLLLPYWNAFTQKEIMNISVLVLFLATMFAINRKPNEKGR